jgi:thiol-disulfide isomerase/thioredoxin
LNVSLEKAGGLLVSVLDGDGSPVATWTARRLTESGRFSTAKLKAQLAEFTPGAPADEVYRAGLASLPGGKVAWVEFRADWCGWCRRMETLLGQTDASPLLARYYKIITIDTEKNSGAGELATRLGAPQGVEGGIPWFALVDAKGRPIITSEGPQGNIGFPGTAAEFAHFRKMLKTTARGISARELDTVFDALRALTPKAPSEHP